MRKLRIALFVTNTYPVPIDRAKIYPPIELIQILAEEMTRRGHEVTLFASSDSKVKTKIFSGGLVSLNNNKLAISLLPQFKDRLYNAYEQDILSVLYRQALENKFDLIHVHCQFIERVLPFTRFVKIPTIATLHDATDNYRKFVYSLYLKEKNIYFVSISNSQRKEMPQLNYFATIYNGTDVKKYPFNKTPENYFVSAGRILPDKGTHLAVKAAKMADVPLKIFGEIRDKAYWEKDIKPYLDKKIRYFGLVPKNKLINKEFRNAKALLFPIQWNEPFGLVMIESMAVGTPVIALNRGSVPEVIINQKTGFIVKDIRGMANAIKNVEKINRYECRQHAEKNFSLEKMIEEYEKVYKNVINVNKKRLTGN